MCGIFASPSSGRMQAALALMRHRGPDASQVIRRAGFSVGFNRLAIVTTKSTLGAQPHETRKGNVVAFNGEIYNYRKLWREAPSEVALIGEMLDDGLDPRQYFDGEYAILYYNPSIRKLTLYRDRFGVCPLYYHAPQIEVSSEARRLFDAREVPAHGRVVIDMRTSKVETDIMSLYGATSERVSLKVLSCMLEDAVESRATHTDSGFSLALSGGLDSTLIAYALRERHLDPESALCTGFSEQSEDLKLARLIAHQLNFDFYPIVISAAPSQHEEIMEHFDGPVNPMRWRGGLRSYFVAKHSPTRVVLCGDGPDELIGGYHCHYKLGRDYRATAKRLSTIKSMQHFNLDRTNKMGMAHSKEFRAPFLASTLSQYLLGAPLEWHKQMFRRLLRYYGCPDEVSMREYKYSADELAVESVPQ